MKKNKTAASLTRAGVIAALYTTLTLISAMLGLSSGIIQVRISEALCVLPVYNPIAIPALTIGCFISNLMCGGTVYDLVLGTAATLIGASLAYALRSRPHISWLPTAVSNALIVPLVLILQGIAAPSLYAAMAVSVAIGETVSCGIFGNFIIFYIKKHRLVQTMLWG